MNAIRIQGSILTFAVSTMIWAHEKTEDRTGIGIRGANAIVASRARLAFCKSSSDDLWLPPGSVSFAPFVSRLLLLDFITSGKNVMVDGEFEERHDISISRW